MTRLMVTLIVALVWAMPALAQSPSPINRGGGDFHWKPPVASAAALPLFGNTKGDVRIETTTFNLFGWNGATWAATGGGGGGGTVTSVAVATANGFAGTSSGGATPSLTLKTSVTGLLLGNGTGVSAAASGIDYQAPISNFTCSTHQWVDQWTAPNTFTCVQPAFSDLSGTATVAQGGTNSGTALNNNRVMKSAGGAIVEAAAITANRVLTSDANGIPVASSVTDTTLAFLDATSSVQTQLNARTTAVSVATANGFAGSSSGGATPALTLTTTVTGIPKGNGSAFSAATSGTDYAPGTSANTTGIVKSTTGTGALTTAVAADFPTLNQSTTGNALTCTTATNFSGNLAGDVTGPQGTTAIAATTVTGKVLTGYVSGAGTVTSTDTILQAIQKINGNAVAGGTPAPIIQVKFGNYTAASNDDSIIFNIIANATLTLPDCTGMASNHIWKVKNGSTAVGVLTIQSGGSNTFESATGDTILTLSDPGTAAEIQCNKGSVLYVF